MKTNGTRVLAMLLSVIMVMGVLAMLPFSAAAYHMDDKLEDGSRPKGVQVPDGITVYDGVQTATPENGAVALERDDDGAFLIQSAAEFMYFRNVLAVQETLLIGATDAAAEELTSLPASEATFKLTCDIALNTETYGTGGSQNSFGVAPSGTFAGTFDGGNYTIYNMYHYNTEKNVSLALFHTVTGTVKNLNFAGARIMNNFVGTHDETKSALVAINLDGTVDNVHGTSCAFKGSQAAGIAVNMKNGATVKNCTVDGFISGARGAGIVATHNDTNETTEGAYITIENCVNNANVNCTANVDETNNTTGAAGILGIEKNGNNQTTGFRITNCENNGHITAEKYAAGIVAVSNMASLEATITDCVNRGNIVTSVAGGVSGGIAGDVPNRLAEANHKTTVLTRCYNYGNITAAGTAGGIVGRTNPDSKQYFTGGYFKDCGNYGTVTSDGIAGGILGQSSGQYGFVGKANLYFYNCISAGDVNGGTVVGGLVGQAEIRDKTITVAGCMIACHVTGTTQAAALIGNITQQATNGTVALTSSWVTGTVTVAEGGTAALIAISANTTPTKLTATDSGFAVTVKVGETTLTAEEMAGAYYKNSESAFIPVESYKDGSTTVAARYPATTVDAFTDGTAQKSLNTYATNKNYTLWAQGKNAPVIVTCIGFDGATMSLGESMALNMKLNDQAFTNLIGDTGSAKVTFVKNGTADDGNASIKNGYYTVSYTCDAADLAKSAEYYIEVDINGTTYTSTNILTYAPIEYATALYNDEEHPETQDLIEKMLSMASLSEKAKYGAESTAIATAASNAGITLPTEYTIPENMKYYALNTEDANAAIDIIDDYAKTGADLNGNVNLVFEVTDASITKVVVASGDVYNETFEVKDNYVTITGLGAKHIANLITIAFHDANGLVASTGFSVGNYLQNVISNTTDTDTKNLATAMVLYMMSVKAYAGA